MFVRVTVWDCCPPTVTLPKSPLAPLTVNWLSVVPVPVSVRIVVASVASVVTVAPALNVPNVSGVNPTAKVTVCPAATVAGRLGEISAKFFVVIATLLMLTD